MKFNITNIKTGKTKIEEVNFKYKIEKEEINDDRIEMLSDLSINGKVYYADNGVYRFDGIMYATCNFVCDRCMNEFTSDFEADFYEEYKQDVLEDDEDYYKLENDTIDLSEGIVKNFLLNIPIKMLCDEDCEGITYNKEEIYEKNIDESKKKSPFDSLKDLKF